ncbi:MAG: cupin domain-containing protein [Armatimonadota bacterium]|nr:MAG: cupin domain-containing protein [Armatimonadota bacterium]
MRIVDAMDVEAKPVAMEGAKGVAMRVLIGPEMGAPSFVMRMFEVEPGGNTPLHQHAWEHEVFVLAGQGEVASPDERRPLRAGTAAFVPGGETHQFVNPGSDVLRFLCLIPAEG